jgi:hypothetical protein
MRFLTLLTKMTTKTAVKLHYVVIPCSDIRETEEETQRTSFHLRDHNLDVSTLILYPGLQRPPFWC